MVIDRATSPYSSGFSDTVSVSGQGRWVVVSGQVGADEDGRISATEFRAEADQCFLRIRRSLAAAGARMDDVVEITCFLTDVDALYTDYAAARKVAFPGPVPASTTVEVPRLLLGARVEIRASAFVPVELSDDREASL